MASENHMVVTKDKGGNIVGCLNRARTKEDAEKIAQRWIDSLHSFSYDTSIGVEVVEHTPQLLKIMMFKNK